MRLTLMFREYCGLCHDMLARLQSYRASHGIDIEVVDVDADPVLEEKYNELVPVLLAPDGSEICHWHLDDARLVAALAEIG